jgi:hypothetical protein
METIESDYLPPTMRESGKTSHSTKYRMRITRVQGRLERFIYVGQPTFSLPSHSKGPHVEMWA